MAKRKQTGDREPTGLTTTDRTGLRGPVTKTDEFLQKVWKDPEKQRQFRKELKAMPRKEQEELLVQMSDQMNELLGSLKDLAAVVGAQFAAETVVR
jgi:hypothetical protein